MKIPVIQCAVCNGPVEQMTVTERPELGPATCTVSVRCHGDRQVETVDMLAFAPPWKIVAARAFVGASAPFTKETFR